MKTIIWLLQSNQTTPVIINFLKALQTRLEKHINLLFMVPETSSDIITNLKELDPIVFKTTFQTASWSYQAYLSKRNALDKNEFTEGLSFADTLLADDLGGGNAQKITLKIPMPERTCGIIFQIPTPLGSSEMEEKVFQATILWARQKDIPAIGYELLPLDTKWTLAPSLPDGIITRHYESYAHLKSQLAHKNVWLLPPYEASIFSFFSTSFHLNGAKACYHYRNEYSIPANRTILYLPHNVSMIYEYQEMIKILQPLGNKLHLMFGFGEDQVRGTYSQKKMIEIVYGKNLTSFASYSFHDTNSPWEMMMADTVVACAACFNAQIAEQALIPCIIFDPTLSPMIRGNKNRVTTKATLLKHVNETIARHQHKIEFADILMFLTKRGKGDE